MIKFTKTGFLIIIALALCFCGTEVYAQKYTTLGYRTCGTGKTTCHKSDYDWWKDDNHFKTVNDIKRKERRSQQIAQLYGMNPQDYLKGGSRCGECHGEQKTGREKKNMNAGVSCESCHGPSGPENKGYFTVHQEGALLGNPLDEGRSGYKKALKVGLNRLRDVNVRAKNCIDCHHIDEKALLEAGHPTGEGFDYTGGIKKSISGHWDYKLRPVDTDSKPYDNILAKRPIPAFTLKGAPAAAAPVSQGGGGTRIVYKYINRGQPAPDWLNPEKTVEIDAFEPEISDSTTVEEILEMIKKRIEEIHQKINGKE